MNGVRLGRQVRALRRHRQWRQEDLAGAARVGRGIVSRIERGRADGVTLRALNQVVQALDASLEAWVRWNGEALDRLLDADHAAIVEIVARRLRGLGWQVSTEVSFNIRGERGSIDILALHPETGALLVVEVKSVVPDVQAMLVSIDRKARLALQVARERGWIGRTVSRLMVIREGRTARRRVDQHRVTFETAFPVRGVAVRRWLQRPERAINGLWFVSDAHSTGARHRVARRTAPSHAGPPSLVRSEAANRT